MNNLPSDKLKAFMVLCQLKDLSLTSKKTGIPKEDILEILSELESKLKAKLCHINGDSITLSQNGKLLKKKLSPLYHKIISIEKMFFEK